MLINKQLFDLWKVSIPEGNRIPGHVTPTDLAAAPQHLKTGISPGLH